jgi:hypothetical protein
LPLLLALQLLLVGIQPAVVVHEALLMLGLPQGIGKRTAALWRLQALILPAPLCKSAVNNSVTL